MSTLGMMPPEAQAGALPPTGNLRQEALEVVQAIQNPAHDVALIAGKSTVVRIYLGVDGDVNREAVGLLDIGANGQTVTVASLGPIVVAPSENGDLQAKRRSIGKSLIFAVPPALTSAGTMTVRLAELMDPTDGRGYSFPAPTPTTVDFVSGPPLRLRLIGFRYNSSTPAGAAGTFVPRDRDVELLISWLTRAYPVPNVEIDYVVMDAPRDWPLTATLINSRLIAVRNLDIASGTDQRTHYYGLVHDGGGPNFMRGRASGIPTVADPSVVAKHPAGNHSA